MILQTNPRNDTFSTPTLSSTPCAEFTSSRHHGISPHFRHFRNSAAFRSGDEVVRLARSPLPSVHWLAASWVQIGAAEWEMILGIWMLSGKYPLSSWLAALGTFTTFAGVSGYLGLIGQTRCGCFGSIQASPNGPKPPRPGHIEWLPVECLFRK